MSNELNKQIDADSLEKVNPGWGCRHFQAFLLFLVLSCAHGMRTSMSIAVIAMTDITTPKERAITFDWAKSQQDYILSSFYWGYMVMQIPSGQLSYRYGGKILIIVGLVLNGVATLAIPLAAQFGGWKGVCCFRCLQGVTQGCIVPAIHTLLGKWSPLAERNRMGSFIYSGASFGIIVSLSSSGFLSASDFGWPGIFYSFGAVSIAVGILWGIYGAASPATHKSISYGERSYIEDSVGNTDNVHTIKVPWRAIFTSSRVFALVVTQGGCVYGFVMLQTEIPSFLKMAHKVEVKNSALLTTLPVCAGWVFAMVFSQIADTILNKKLLTPTTMRKIANTIATWVPALLLIVLTTIPAGSIILTMVLITLIAGFDTICCSGFMMNHIDLSPRFAGTLMSISNLAGSITAQMAPLSAAAILDDPNDIRQWRGVFYLSAAVWFFTNLVFILMGTAEKQPWDNPTECKNIEEPPAETDSFMVAKMSEVDKNTALFEEK